MITARSATRPRDLRRRVEALEAARATDAQGPRLLVLLAPNAQPLALALPDGRRVDRLPGESQDQLIERVAALPEPGEVPVIASAIYDLG